MLLSASRRTDIPAYYGEWFVNRLKAGYALVRNPMNAAQLFSIPLSPDIVDCIVFWTKDSCNFMPFLPLLDEMGYRYYFQFTLTPYGKDIEPGLREKTAIEETFIALSEKIGRERVLWRYDPIIINDSLPVDAHKAHFRRLCQKLSPYTQKVTVSFLDLYPKLRSPLLREASPAEMAELAGFIGRTAAEYGLNAAACCEKADLTPYGIARASCIDKALVEKLCGCPLHTAPDKNQRPGCGCDQSVDIGSYNTCPGGCIYCYANPAAGPQGASPAVLRRFARHNPRSELLTGEVQPEETVKKRELRSDKILQQKML